MMEKLPIVAMTASAMVQDCRRFMDAGMNDFLVKPIDPQELRYENAPPDTASRPDLQEDTALRG